MKSIEIFGKNKDIYIVEWVDIDLSSGVDKCFIYKTSKDNLSKYFEESSSSSSARNAILSSC